MVSYPRAYPSLCSISPEDRARLKTALDDVVAGEAQSGSRGRSHRKCRRRHLVREGLITYAKCSGCGASSWRRWT